MNKLNLLVPALFLCAVSMWTQDVPHVHMAPPPASMDPDNTKQTSDTPTLPKRIDLVQLQKEADDLSRTAQTIPSDLANVRKGVLPKDVLQKLKQIEKMSKHLRTELNP